MTEERTSRVGEDVDFSAPAPADGYAAATAPAVTSPTWSGKKTAVAAALAIGAATLGAVGAAAAVPEGTGASTGRFDHGGPGGQVGPPGQFGRGPGQQGGPGTGLPGQRPGAPAGGAAPQNLASPT